MIRTPCTHSHLKLHNAEDHRATPAIRLLTVATAITMTMPMAKYPGGSWGFAAAKRHYTGRVQVICSDLARSEN